MQEVPGVFGLSVEERHRRLPAPTAAAAAGASASHQIAPVQNAEQTRTHAAAAQTLTARRRLAQDRS
jgi:hypothetical protein